ncbi:hypothetical protein CAPTEDRAFT_203496 [Capitella teleta]|uniref:Uncharacterized protein n=1 Tax=Capitella teleta TaxID=283909 RepID=R7V6R5_CAPTE|nr:hypothetical protein CAPTEDRAFT_203496 [Capitella teleta]|eukprot:ELU14142.1 hypothetical protein CAPTEDRAFT_203496 [Capitella teleta]
MSGSQQNWLGSDDSDPSHQRENLVEVHDWLQGIPIPEANQKEEEATPGGSPGDSVRRTRRVRIVVDSDDEDDTQVYCMKASVVAAVPYSSVTWDNMAMGLRIALQTRTLYSCDGFLGDPKAKLLHEELQNLKKSGFFGVYMRRSDNREYACAKLTQPEVEHRHIDGLVLIVYKLSQYFSKQLLKPRVNVLYYPNGMPRRSYEGDKRVLTCVYCCTPGVPLNVLKGSSKQDDSLTDHYEYKFDRLLAFWCNDRATLDAIDEELFQIEILLTHQ